MRLIFSLFLSCLLIGCGYRTYEGELSCHYPTLSIPYIEGDINGEFTAKLTHQIATLSDFRIVRDRGDLILQAKILKDDTHHIGYQYDRKKISGERIERLIPNEGRRVLLVEFSLYERGTNCLVKGPFQVEATADYDFVDPDSVVNVTFLNPSGTRLSVLDFSLGQLDSSEGARDAARHPLYTQLAKKIASGISR